MWTIIISCCHGDGLVECNNFIIAMVTVSLPSQRWTKMVSLAVYLSLVGKLKFVHVIIVFSGYLILSDLIYLQLYLHGHR